MTSYQHFPRSGIQQHVTGGGGNGQPAAFVPYAPTGGGLGAAGGGAAAAAGYAEAHQRSPSAGGGAGMIPVRMADGTQGFAPAQQMQQMSPGGGQWGYGQQGGHADPGMVSNGSSPGGMGLGGMSLLQQQMTGYSAMQASLILCPYGAEAYQQTDVQTKRSSKGGKKAKEWEREQRAREEAEEKFRQQTEMMAQQTERDRLRQNPVYTSERNRRQSAGAGLQPAQSINDLNQRFNTMAMASNVPANNTLNPNAATMMAMAGTGGQYTRPRGLSVSAQDRDVQDQYGSGVRSRRVSVTAGGGADPRESIDFGNNKVRTRKMSAAAQNPYQPTFYDDEVRGGVNGGVNAGGLQVGKSPFVRPGSLPPGAFVSPDGRVMIPNPAHSGGGGPPMPLAPQMTGGAASMYGGGVGSGYGSSPNGGNTRIMVPNSFYREPSRSVSYTRFTPFAIIWDLNELKQLVPPLPALLVPNDVHHDDWNRCISDVTTSWSGIFPYNLWNDAKKQASRRNSTIQNANRPGYRGSGVGSRIPTMRPSSAVSRTVDIWNLSFFHDRGLELVLYRGLERRTGDTAGSRMERMKMDLVPQQYQLSIMGRKKRRPPVTPLGRGGRRGDEDDDDDEIDSQASSLTSSSESSSSSSEDEEEENEEEDEEDDGYGGTQRRYKSTTKVKSRRNSMAPGAGVDPYERWATKSRSGWKLIEKRQKLQRKRRKLERKQRQQLMREEPLYSMWMSCRDAR
ncbi:hypothetical protein FRB98_007213 [Tulasnella sp. 332]|nr:hypothetical protein FRB98_007213 [Tulasnella sp. 332]